MKRFLTCSFLIGLISAAIISAGCKAKPLNYGNSGRVIVAFGDSITAGYGVSKQEAYPALLAKLTGRQVINLGVSGETAAQGLNRIESIKPYKPYMVLIEFSGNDFLKRRPLAETEKSLLDMVEYAQKQGAIAVLVETGGNFTLKPYKKMMKQIAKDKEALFVPAIMEGILNKSSLKADTIHPNAAGHKIVAGRIFKTIKPYL
ncbi:MAG: GDSL-type esterase/lipase family protein [Elusimicrobiota bacterium]|jgi:lysophospholipase L1-like esterase|nr:GDSL-type esterase/lipase family protein [Elusimicrobiota bacterium]